MKFVKMVRCAFCELDFTKDNLGFINPKEMSQESRQVWLDWSEDYRKKTNKTELGANDKVCQNHFAKDAKYKPGRYFKLKKDAIPTIKISVPCPESTLSPPKKYPISKPSPQAPKQSRPALREQNSPANVTIKRVDPNSPSRFQCEDCGKSYKEEKNLELHIVLHHKIDCEIVYDEPAADENGELDKAAGLQVDDRNEWEENEVYEDEWNIIEENAEEAFDDGENEPVEPNDGSIPVGGEIVARMKLNADLRQKKRNKNHPLAEYDCMVATCKKKFMTKGNQKRHIVKYHPEKFAELAEQEGWLLICYSKTNRRYCGKTFKSLEELKDHKLEQHPICCNLCDRKFAYAFELNSHKTNYHKQNPRTIEGEEEKLKQKCEAIDVDNLNCIKKTADQPKANKMLLDFFRQYLSINGYVAADMLTVILNELGYTQEEFDEEVANTPYFKGLTDKVESLIEAKIATYTLAEFKEIYVSRVGGTLFLEPRINEHKECVHDELVSMFYDEQTGQVRNIYAECLYVAVEVDIAELQITERMIRYNLKQRDYIVLEDNSNLIKDHKTFMRAAGEGKGWVYVFFYKLKYSDLMCLSPKAAPYVPKKFRHESYFDALNALSAAYSKVEGEWRWKVPIEDDEVSERSIKHAEEIACKITGKRRPG